MEEASYQVYEVSKQMTIQVSESVGKYVRSHISKYVCEYVSKYVCKFIRQQARKSFSKTKNTVGQASVRERLLTYAKLQES